MHGSNCITTSWKDKARVFVATEKNLIDVNHTTRI